MCPTGNKGNLGRQMAGTNWKMSALYRYDGFHFREFDGRCGADGFRGLEETKTNKYDNDTRSVFIIFDYFYLFGRWLRALSDRKLTIMGIGL